VPGIYESITDTIGATPLVKIARLEALEVAAARRGPEARTGTFREINRSLIGVGGGGATGGRAETRVLGFQKLIKLTEESVNLQRKQTSGGFARAG